MPIKIDITKAKNIWKDKIRVARKPKLEELDIEFNKAQEAGSDTSAIVTKKQEAEKKRLEEEAKKEEERLKRIEENKKIVIKPSIQVHD